MKLIKYLFYIISSIYFIHNIHDIYTLSHNYHNLMIKNKYYKSLDYLLQACNITVEKFN